MSNTLEQFKEYLNKINQYSRINTLLSWDMYTATPKLGYDGMADALTYFSTEQFVLSTADELYDMLQLLSQPEEYGQLDEAMQFTVRTMKRDMEKSRRIPRDFYESFVSAQNESMRAWREAKQTSDFSLFAPHLEKLIEMTRQKCSYTDPGRNPYNVLLDQFEEGVDAAAIDQVFGELKEGLIPLVQKVLAAPQPDSSIFQGIYDKNAQKKVQELLLNYIGFSMDAGVTSESEHPFTTGFSRNDVRITNHYYEDNPISAIFSAIHEGGHGIFEQNVNPALEGTPADDCCYMGVHESQSRFYENILGRNKNFWLPIYPKLQELLPPLKNVSLDEFYREINHVQASFIRTESDELTYGLHIIIRYEIEQAIFRDNVPVSELPALWNQKMQEYLHITPANDAEGILQDIHWSDGSFGYFPSYLLGNIYDGMFLESLEKDLGSLDEILAAGNIRTVTDWLNRHIHWYGSLRLPKQVLQEVCGKPLSAQPLLTYFTKKYTALYRL
ncbi:MAG: carboxypeptidase M32 [Lachnospiraceae bacterium]|nr:carboxypeptidase M32 [Lachnospiraceae bacterium]